MRPWALVGLRGKELVDPTNSSQTVDAPRFERRRYGVLVGLYCIIGGDQATVSSRDVNRTLVSLCQAQAQS